jgi:hypothetical protein
MTIFAAIHTRDCDLVFSIAAFVLNLARAALLSPAAEA